MLKLACGEKVKDSFYSGQCRERIEAVLKNLCMVSSNDEKAAGELLFAVRFKKGMSQSEIARAEGVSRQAISQRIKRSSFSSQIQKTMKRMKKENMEHRGKMVYEQYMAGVRIKEIKGCSIKQACAIAEDYAKKHNLPFVARWGWGHKRRGKK